MSADSWGVCPVCAREEASKAKELRKKADDLYGSIEPSEYLKLVGTSKGDGMTRGIFTLREDYEIRTNIDGTFRVSYGCHCSVCDFEFEFRHEEDVLPVENVCSHSPCANKVVGQNLFCSESCHTAFMDEIPF